MFYNQGRGRGGSLRAGDEGVSPLVCDVPGLGRTGCGGWGRPPPGTGSTEQSAGSRAGSRLC